MFEFSLKKQDLLTPLLTVAGAVDKKQSLAILSNILLTFQKDHIVLTATDLEIEISARIPCVGHQNEGSVTIPANFPSRLLTIRQPIWLPDIISTADFIVVSQVIVTMFSGRSTTYSILRSFA